MKRKPSDKKRSPGDFGRENLIKRIWNRLKSK